MSHTKKTIFFSILTTIGLIATLSPYSAQAFPDTPGNLDNSTFSACYHNGQYYRTVYLDRPCPEDPQAESKHCLPNEPCAYEKHTTIDCIVTRVPVND